MYLCRTQAIVSDDLGMVNYAAYSTPKGEMKTRDIKVHQHQLWHRFIAVFRIRIKIRIRMGPH